ncbi:DUF4846 domain-containing protein [Lacrimispora sp. JR3]|uniref:DUF4846 domain-containing protein n=1 Tax=Lacrimispora sinapis TaxID=3111456 RepID=UPI003748BA13
MNKWIYIIITGGLFCVAAVQNKELLNKPKVILETNQVPHAGFPSEEPRGIHLTERTGKKGEEAASAQPKQKSIINPSGNTLEERLIPPDGYERTEKPLGSLQGFLRNYALKPDKSPVLLFDGSRKKKQEVHAAVFSMPLVKGDLQQCADSAIRIYGEYLWSVGVYDAISFHLTNGFLMDYPSWRSGKRLSVEGNQVRWEERAVFDDSRENFLKYLRQVMIYAGTLSLENESGGIVFDQLQAGDLFIRGGTPGHCVMVVDVAEDQEGNKCFLLAQGYMPAQEFHVLKNPLHKEDPWYYVSEIKDSLVTPEYVFEKDSLKRWKAFLEK